MRGTQHTARNAETRTSMSDYYQSNHQAYHEKTFSIDPSSFLKPFVSRLAEGAVILDVGCGSGRDLLWLKNRGFNMIGFERSKGLAKLARENSGCKVIEGDFEIYDFSELSVDAILMSGSLVHVPHEKLPDVFENINRALARTELSAMSYEPKADLYISLKEGTGSRTDEHGRIFYLWQDSGLRDLFDKQGFSVIDFSRSQSVIRAGDIWLGYVLEKNEVN